jgi:hypothetical membrane protein
MAETKIINTEDHALRLTLPVTIGAYALFFLIGLLYQRNNIPLTNVQLGFSIIGVSFFVPFYFLLTIFYKKLKEDAKSRAVKFSFNSWFWRDFLISLSYAIIFGVIGFLIAALIAASFKQFVYQPYSYAIWPTLAAAGWAYFSINLAEDFVPTDLINIVAIFLIGGVSLSAILNPNPLWWEESISYLGMNKYPSATILNLSLIFSGLLLVVLSTFLGRRFDELKKRKLITENANNILKTVFLFAPIGLACVGFFPYMDTAPRMYIHNLSAFVAFGFFGILMLLTYWVLPLFSKYYMRINYSLLAILAGIFVLNVTGYLTLALTETMAFGIIAVWMLLFLRSLNGAIDWSEV